MLKRKKPIRKKENQRRDDFSIIINLFYIYKLIN